MNAYSNHPGAPQIDSVTFPLPWYLVGLPGSGKSRVGRMLAEQFEVDHLDTDQMIEANTGQSINEIFRSKGEAVFRAIESDTILGTGNHEAVISLGGGAVETEEVLDFLLGKTVFWVQADVEELVRRTSKNRRRPLLAKDPDRVLKQLAMRRNPLYGKVATLAVKSTAEPPRRVVQQLMNQIGRWGTVQVNAPVSYPVIIGPGSSAVVAQQIPDDATKVFFVVPKSLKSLAGPLQVSLENRGLEVELFDHPDGEKAKDLAIVAQGWDAMGNAKIGRRDLVVTFGGGVTTDMGGFLAATWLRGIRVIHVPTSLLAMVDAAIGGKTGMNTSFGKNLVGAFHDPLKVVIDTNLLTTLPQPEYTAGLAEILKAGFISDPVILDVFETNHDLYDQKWATTTGIDLLTNVISRAVDVKARVVGQDRLEQGLREILNYGHTLAHAIERNENYQIRHGEAVAIGCIFAAELALALGVLDANTVARHRTVFESAGLPTQYEGSFEDLVDTMTSDKKVRSSKIRFVLLDSLGSPFVREVPTEELARIAPRVGIKVNGESN